MMRRTLVAVTLALSFASPALGQWSQVASPPSDFIEKFLSAPEALYAGTLTGKVFASVDHGASWAEIAGGFEAEYAPVSSMARAGDTFVMSRAFSPDGLNFRSTFDGSAWSPWDLLPDQTESFASLVAIGNTVFGSWSDGSLHRSDDGGTTWASVATPLGVATWDLRTRGGELHFVAGGAIHRTSDLGATWTSEATPGGTTAVMSYEFFGSVLVLSQTLGGGAGVLWQSPDDGATWTEVATAPTFYHLNGMAELADGRLVVGAASGSDGGSIFVTSDLATWENHTGDLPGFAHAVNELFTQDGWLFKTGGSVTPYRSPEPVSVGVEEGSGPEHFLAVRPNPTRGATKIAVETDAGEPLRVAVFDAAGRLVDTVFDGVAAGGARSYTWNSSDAAAGVYYVVGKRRAGSTIVPVTVVR